MKQPSSEHYLKHVKNYLEIVPKDIQQMEKHSPKSVKSWKEQQEPLAFESQPAAIHYFSQLHGTAPSSMLQKDVARIQISFFPPLRVQEYRFTLGGTGCQHLLSMSGLILQKPSSGQGWLRGLECLPRPSFYS